MAFYMTYRLKKNDIYCVTTTNQNPSLALKNTQAFSNVKRQCLKSLNIDPI